MGIQIIKIKESMEQSKHKIPIDLKRSKLFANLLGHVSRVALDILKKERHRMRSVVTVDARTCGCFYRRTHGLPCCHEMALTKEMGGSIPLSSIHDFWKKLEIELGGNSIDPCPSKADFETVWNEIQKAPIPM